MAMLTILEGSTFCICDEIGDLDGQTSGFFTDDTRFLSELRLTVSGARALLLSSGKVEYFSAAFFLRNPLAGGLAQDVLSIKRERFVGEGMQDQIVVANQSMEAISFELGLAISTDFADIMSVKEHDFSLGDPLRAKPLPDPVEPQFDGQHNQYLFEATDGEQARTQLFLSQPGDANGQGVKWQIELQPRESWHVRIDVVATLDGDEVVQPRTVERHF